VGGGGINWQELSIQSITGKQELVFRGGKKSGEEELFNMRLDQKWQEKSQGVKSDL